MTRNLETTRAAAAHLDAKHEILAATSILSRQLQSRDTTLSQSLATLGETLAVMNRREDLAIEHSTPQSRDAFRLLEELKASLLSGDLGRLRDRLWTDEPAPDGPDIDLRKTAVS